MAFPIFGSNPNVKFASAAAYFNNPNALTTGIGILSQSPPILKFWSDL